LFYTLLQVSILKVVSVAGIGFFNKQKSGCLIAKPAAGFLDVPLTGTNYIQLVITCQLERARAGDG